MIDEVLHIKDSLNRKIDLIYPPKRIISLVPSITELLFDLGLEEQIVGVTKYCIHPKKALQKTIVGGTKNANYLIINELKPDLIIAEKSENFRNNILKIAENHTVYVFDVFDFDSAIAMIRRVGYLTNQKAQARIITDKIIQNFTEFNIDFRQKTVFFPVWKKPYITVSANTFINSILNICGLKNIFADKNTAYPRVSAGELRERCPDFIFLPSEPCSFTSEDVAEFSKLCPKSKILNVDGQMFAWYGSRMLYAAEYFADLQKKLFG